MAFGRGLRQYLRGRGRGNAVRAGHRNLTNADIRDKYAKLTRRLISADRQAAIEKAVLGIDTLDDIAQLTALLIPAVHSPLG